MAFVTLPCAVFTALTTIASAGFGYHSEYGYGVRDCVPGYDADCDEPNGPPLPQGATTTEEPTVTIPEEPKEPSTTGKQNCTMHRPSECVFPFKYKDLMYKTCTGVDAHEALWCSTTANYSGHWKRCESCQGNVPTKEIVGGVLAGSVAAAGIGLIATAIHNNMVHGEFNPFMAHTAAPAASTAVPTVPPTAPPIVAKQATPNSPGVEVISIPIAVPAPAPAITSRRLSEFGAKASGFLAPGAPASQTWTWALAAAGLFATVALVGGFRKFMRSNARRQEGQPSQI